jgi:hypothetical protein
MVGYVEDATVTSQIRFRFDAGFGNNKTRSRRVLLREMRLLSIRSAAYSDLETPGPGPDVPTEMNFQQFETFARRSPKPDWSSNGSYGEPKGRKLDLGGHPAG